VLKLKAWRGSVREMLLLRNVDSESVDEFMNELGNAHFPQGKTISVKPDHAQIIKEVLSEVESLESACGGWKVEVREDDEAVIITSLDWTDFCG